MVDAALLNWTIDQLMRVLIVMTRVGPLLFLMPVLSARGVPAQVKILLVVMTSLVLAPVVPVSSADLPDTAVGFGVFAALEITFAAILALFARFVFSAVETAGQVVGVQMGMGMAGVMDPQFGNQVSPVGMLWSVAAILLFLAIDGHHLFFAAMVRSYQWVGPGQLAAVSHLTYQGMMDGAAQMFVLAIKIMAPASATLFFSHVGMGIIAKTVPQIPILIVGMPMNIALGMMMAGLSMGYFVPVMLNHFEMLHRLLPRIGAGLG
ncbi:flagellar biosynthetic protein FliR [Desulfurivibrio alkaliphilus]|uniref:Flagellar biosynthetic protein FliR n=1 Tax=Desulfurivibrio alkaliphilus (strain DSM 19089 / UNIQEM U267 / AHT2) TaxID=589865 RepID=D6Z4D7_DESAT|nr:flagellar biosynthetic protein FliR [Desulfurivibrio alkaliphilus]ADH86412.1 flagellar biosynthetic protein FliR [Desulfurivibrio alkaliphilus AHT 2]